MRRTRRNRRKITIKTPASNIYSGVVGVGALAATAGITQALITGDSVLLSGILGLGLISSPIVLVGAGLAIAADTTLNVYEQRKRYHRYLSRHGHVDKNESDKIFDRIKSKFSNLPPEKQRQILNEKGSMFTYRRG
jgi:hypothetical protein